MIERPLPDTALTQKNVQIAHILQFQLPLSDKTIPFDYRLQVVALRVIGIIALFKILLKRPQILDLRIVRGSTRLRRILRNTFALRFIHGT